MWNEIIIEILFLGFLGFLYFLYQKRKINNDEIQRLYFWQQLLKEARDLFEINPQSELEEFIADLDDILKSNDPIPNDIWISQWLSRKLPLEIKSKFS